ncbi:MAG TPA: hypothetical protein VKQ30_11935 [Ktedonobacterales bacterium]|jgi:hypothetical protein|nr:hypothetical protein [Ktedonobacterales bacterium]
MRTFLRWWETLGRPERIVAMSLTAGGIVAVANSLTWAVAVCYMSRQRAQAARWRATRLPAAAETSDDARAVPNRRAGVPLPLA